MNVVENFSSHLSWKTLIMSVSTPIVIKKSKNDCQDEISVILQGVFFADFIHVSCQCHLILSQYFMINKCAVYKCVKSLREFLCCCDWAESRPTIQLNFFLKQRKSTGDTNLHFRGGTAVIVYTLKTKIYSSSPTARSSNGEQSWITSDEHQALDLALMEKDQSHDIYP